MIDAALIFLAPFFAAWIGHAYLCVLVLNNLYARAIPKAFLKRYRLFTGLVILAYPIALVLVFHGRYLELFDSHHPLYQNPFGIAFLAYLVLAALMGLVFLAVTFFRLLRRDPVSVESSTTRTLDLWPVHGAALLGDGYWRWMPRLPGNCVFQVDFTEVTLAVRNLPREWDGLTVLLLSDLHFHGTPSRLFFEEIVKRIEPAVVVVLAGDFVDTLKHHEWIAPVLGPLRWKECGLAVLGNHDTPCEPERVRDELAGLGYRVLGNRWDTVTIRGVPCIAVGHEGPWFAPPPEVSAAPAGPFRLCVSHTPDNVYWGNANGIDLMLSGHVHGGQVRLPVIGSIFVPSLHSRRFDMGVFDVRGTTLVVSRGLSGKEPLRFRCHPQVMRLTLKPA